MKSTLAIKYLLSKGEFDYSSVKAELFLCLMLIETQLMNNPVVYDYKKE